VSDCRDARLSAVIRCSELGMVAACSRQCGVVGPPLPTIVCACTCTRKKVRCEIVSGQDSPVSRRSSGRMRRLMHCASCGHAHPSYDPRLTWDRQGVVYRAPAAVRWHRRYLKMEQRLLVGRCVHTSVPTASGIAPADKSERNHLQMWVFNEQRTAPRSSLRLPWNVRPGRPVAGLHALRARARPDSRVPVRSAGRPHACMHPATPVSTRTDKM